MAMADLTKRNPFHFHTSDGQTGITLSVLPVPVAFAAGWSVFEGQPTAA